MKTSTGSGVPRWRCLTRRAWESEPPAAHLTWVRRRRAAGFTHSLEVRACPLPWDIFVTLQFVTVRIYARLLSSIVMHLQGNFFSQTRCLESSLSPSSPVRECALIFGSPPICFTQIWQASAVLLYETASISSKFLFPVVSLLAL